MACQLERCISDTVNLDRLAEVIVWRARFLFKTLAVFGGVRCIQRRLPTKQSLSQRRQGKNIITYEPIRVLLAIVAYGFYALFR